MTARSVTHATLVIERTYEAAPARVFEAWANPVAKARWFKVPDEWDRGDYALDFRVGGREHSAGGPPGGPMHRYDAIYQDIVPDERIIYSYEMHLDDTRISVSLATVELKPAGTGTWLVVTEQGAFLDGFDEPSSREQGMGHLVDALGELLRREATGA